MWWVILRLYLCFSVAISGPLWQRFWQGWALRSMRNEPLSSILCLIYYHRAKSNNLPHIPKLLPPYVPYAASLCWHWDYCRENKIKMSDEANKKLSEMMHLVEKALVDTRSSTWSGISLHTIRSSTPTKGIKSNVFVILNIPWVCAICIFTFIASQPRW